VRYGLSSGHVCARVQVRGCVMSASTAHAEGHRRVIIGDLARIIMGA
jgi:hypothetical protein